METTVREFQRNFARMCRIASQGNVVRVKARERVYSFRAEAALNGFFGVCGGSGDADHLEPEETGTGSNAWQTAKSPGRAGCR
jgi:hypothetical protein